MKVASMPSEATPISAGHAFDPTGAVLVIPLGAPVPPELSEIDVPSGTLYARLAPISVKDDAPRFVAVTGSELSALSSAWTALKEVPTVYWLAGLPATRYDSAFELGIAALGIRRLDWLDVRDAIHEFTTTRQRLQDAQPWTTPGVMEGEAAAPTPPKRPRATFAPPHQPSETPRAMQSSLPRPEGFDDED